MELRLANTISNLLVLGFNFFLMDVDYFFSRVHFFFHDFPKKLTTKWDILWGKMQKSKISSEPLIIHCCREKSGLEKRSIPFAEINSILKRVGIEGLDDCENKSNLDEDDLVGMFDLEEPSFDEIKEAFKVFDANEDGFIDAAELQRVVVSLGLKDGWCSLDECRRMINHVDVNGDGFIDFQEFVILMEKSLC